MRTEQPTLAKLNETDDPKRFGGERLGDDGRNELWLFRDIGRVANRFEDDETGPIWDGDIEGWNYTEEYALD